MPQHVLNFEGRRRGTYHSTCKTNGLVNGQVPGTGLVNEAAAHNGRPAAATRISECAPAGTLNGTKPQGMVNGYINHGYKGKSTSRTLRKQGNKISAVSDASAAGRVSGGDISGGISVNGATSLDTVVVPGNSDQMARKPRLSAAVTNQRRRKKFRHKKRNTEVVCQENSTLILMPPREEEDWDNEIQEVMLTDWENMCFGVRPYGPEDVLPFALRDLTLKQTDTVDLPVTANYRPAIHHPCPLQWSCYKVPPEPDQFADADE
ncbi:uncharacterized protein LOC108875811 isoform X1 [Lates japonicus]|uniref:Uncharacterized protein n=1 Tax=Lates japonicus TaxID=270547 RepID=A0AAD3N5E5_LATJO|nr:uncharacterized protein AKAME5_001771500 [Lates japonicus]